MNATPKRERAAAKRKRGRGAAILDEVESELRRYVYLPQAAQYHTVVLWIAATHAVDQWDHATRLPIVSPEKRCGKSRMLDIIERLCHDPLMTVNASVAAVTRSITKTAPHTLLIDEADSIFGTKRAAENHEDLRGLVNAGYQRNRPVIRWDVTQRRREALETFAMVALASIKDLPDTIMDRGPVIRMRRRSKNDVVLPFRHKRDGARLAPLQKKLAKWVKAQDLGEPVTDMPVEDRAADNWEPLIAIADAAGGEWPLRARNAAKVLTDDEEAVANESFGLELLRNIREIWTRGGAKTHSAALLAALIDMEESPWGRYNTTGLDMAAMARLLKPYGVRSDQVKINGKNAKGYRIDGFKPKGASGGAALTGGLQAAWDAYLPDVADAGMAEPGGDDDE